MRGTPLVCLIMTQGQKYEAPDIYFYAAKTYKNPSIENIINTVKDGLPDPLMGQHKMQGTYSNPSTAKDFIASGVKAIAAGNTLGASIL